MGKNLHHNEAKTLAGLKVQEIIRARYSVRVYQRTPIAEATRAALAQRLAELPSSPFGSQVRFSLAAATDEARAALRGLGTYGFIKNPAGFIVGAVAASAHALEDFGYQMETAILEATALGLGTCWLGGSFTQSNFAARIDKQDNEIIPAVTATGYPDPQARAKDVLRRGARADTRLAWEALFFTGGFDQPMTDPTQAGEFAPVLEMVRLAPSASNKQPWRIVKDGLRWHFYCQRTPGYGQGSWLFDLLHLADLQRLDVGIAMSHFALSAQALGRPGEWTAQNPHLPPIDAKTLYIATWDEAAHLPVGD